MVIPTGNDNDEDETQDCNTWSDIVESDFQSFYEQEDCGGNGLEKDASNTHWLSAIEGSVLLAYSEQPILSTEQPVRFICLLK